MYKPKKLNVNTAKTSSGYKQTNMNIIKSLYGVSIPIICLAITAIFTAPLTIIWPFFKSFYYKICHFNSKMVSYSMIYAHILLTPSKLIFYNDETTSDLFGENIFNLPRKVIAISNHQVCTIINFF